MADLDKTIKAMEFCNRTDGCGGSKCPYYDEKKLDVPCFIKVRFDALELLKEKQPKAVKDIHYVADLFIGQCPSCGEGLNNEVYPGFCGFCGQQISWKDSEQE